jgi:hypothetical protein
MGKKIQNGQEKDKAREEAYRDLMASHALGPKNRSWHNNMEANLWL